jgi:hypothetical protein
VRDDLSDGWIRRDGIREHASCEEEEGAKRVRGDCLRHVSSWRLGVCVERTELRRAFKQNLCLVASVPSSQEVAPAAPYNQLLTSFLINAKRRSSCRDIDSDYWWPAFQTVQMSFEPDILNPETPSSAVRRCTAPFHACHVIQRKGKKSRESVLMRHQEQWFV